MIAEAPNLVDQFVAARGHVLAFVLAATRDIHVAEDVVQELSVHVLRQVERGGAAPADPFAWVMGAARHRVADHYRARQRDARRLARILKLADAAHAAFLDHPPRLDEATGAAGEGGDVEDPRLPHLRECLGRLTAKARSMLDARYARSQSVEAIAGTFSWTAGSVKVALAKARKVLGECVRRKLAAAAGGNDE